MQSCRWKSFSYSFGNTMTDVLYIVRWKVYVTTRCVTESNKYLWFKLSLTNKTSLKQYPCMGIHILEKLSSYTFIAVGQFKYPHTQGTYIKPILVVKITKFLLSYTIQGRTLDFSISTWFCIHNYVLAEWEINIWHKLLFLCTMIDLYVQLQVNNRFVLYWSTWVHASRKHKLGHQAGSSSHLYAAWDVSNDQHSPHLLLPVGTMSIPQDILIFKVLKRLLFPSNKVCALSSNTYSRNSWNHVT